MARAVSRARLKGGDSDDSGRAYDRELLRRLWPFIRPHWRSLLLSLLLLPLGAALQLVPPMLLKAVIDEAIVPRQLERLAPLAAALIGALVLQSLVTFGQTLAIQICGQRAMHDLRRAAHRHLISLRTAFFDRTPVGQVMTRVTNDIESIAEAFASGLVAVVGDVFKLVGIAAVMLWLDARLTLLAFAFLPLLLGVVAIFQRLLRAAYRAIRRRLARINAALQEHITGMKVVQIFGRERAARAEFEVVNGAFRSSYNKANKYDATLFAVVEMLGSLTVALLLWYGGVGVAGGAATFGLLVAFIEYVQRFFEPVRDISAKYAVMQQAMAASERVFKLLDTDEPDCPPSQTEEAPDAPEADEPATPAVEFSGVSFSYDGTTPVLEELSFAVARGENVAVVGATGAGKSTIVRLLTRLYEAEEGTIALDGRDVRRIDPSELRRRVVVLSQDVFLFAGTVRENISLGDPSIDGEAIAAAAERVGLTRLLDLEREVRERGQNLSLGERQLVVFARALVREPELLVLDEATASVDPESERLVQEGIAELMRRRTAIVVAHRLSTVEQADRVIVLHGGRVVEQGSHEQLIAQDGIYARLHELQYVDG